MRSTGRIALFSSLFVLVLAPHAEAAGVCDRPPPPGDHPEWCRACPDRCVRPPALKPLPGDDPRLVPAFCLDAGCMPADPTRERLAAAHMRDMEFLQYGGDLTQPDVDAEVLRSLFGKITAAVALAPGDPHRRYELACALSAAGRPDDAAAQLEPVARADCPECRNALSRLAFGNDTSCGWDDTPRLAALRKAARKTPVFDAALKLVDAFEKGDAAALTALAPKDGTVVIRRQMSLSDPPDDLAWFRVRGIAALRAWAIASWTRADKNGRVDAGAVRGLACEGRCCSAVRTTMSHDTQYLDGFCFTPRGPPRLWSIDVTQG